MARYARPPLSIAAHSEEKAALALLPVQALNIADQQAALLERLGLKTIGQLYEVPREALRARFGENLGARLDQALGKTGEALSALAYEPVYLSRIEFSEPVSEPEAIEDAASLLARHVAAQLAEQGKGARNFTLTLYDTEGECHDLMIALARPDADPGHILRLLKHRLAALEGRFSEALALDGATLLATRVETLISTQTDLMGGESQEHAKALAQLFDRLTAKLGAGAVRRFTFIESHIPERASITVPVLQETASLSYQARTARPFLLLPRPEPITAIAELPDYPPRRFIWRRISYRVVKAEGPERIAAEWWRAGEGRRPPRDYYIVEDEDGHRFWLFREGLYGTDEIAPRWFLHGLFA